MLIEELFLLFLIPLEAILLFPLIITVPVLSLLAAIVGTLNFVLLNKLLLKIGVHPLSYYRCDIIYIWKEITILTTLSLY